MKHPNSGHQKLPELTNLARFGGWLSTLADKNTVGCLGGSEKKRDAKQLDRPVRLIGWHGAGISGVGCTERDPEQTAVQHGQCHWSAREAHSVAWWRRMSVQSLGCGAGLLLFKLDAFILYRLH